MVLSNTSRHGISFLLVEIGLTAITIGLTFGFPRLGAKWFARLERAWRKLAQKKGRAVLVVGASALLLRLAILPLSPIPQPFVQDDFSFLLAADTFASGHLTSPTPVMWQHFESFQIEMRPTYMSMYFPAQGLLLAGGKLLFGHPWFGLLLVTSLMCAALCWMLQAWLPPSWALLGGMIAVLRLGLFSYWIDTYSGGGSIAALGGALVLGALPRLMRDLHARDGWLMAAGIVMLALCRPFEGLLLCAVVGIALARHLFLSKVRPGVLFRRAAMPLVLVLLGVAWLGYYNHRVFGRATTLPYTVDRATYAVVPYWVWQAPRPEPLYHHAVMRDFYVHEELGYFQGLRSPGGFLIGTLFKIMRTLLFYAGIALLPPLIMLRRVLLDRRTRFLVLCVFVLSAGMLLETFLIPHYLAPITAAFYAIGLQAMRHLRLWKPEGQPVGLGLSRLLVALCCVLAILRLFADPLRLRPAYWPSGSWAAAWYSADAFGAPRAKIEAQLEQLSGPQLVIVKYAPGHSSLDEWVYNHADIDASKVIWARAMSAAQDAELLHFYRGRQAWLVEPDVQPVRLSPYPQSAP